ncbi:metallo-hydrolase/oxidoreductase, putative [Plasmodium berghei]|uniref:Metallo-hydrolase/oxidoreductase, putative n=2 Tax=Plasmodium berghei TaxID=5821 RepID=A0A509AHC6_PLABA|nr:metallo-hydrolase/oxidoreductase, putative [Plasmodium berghei ANKA]CXI20461.1 metallo-hydrolase/oxidoreductase, putative [Plasmodium berghei]SCM19960.1 metallo-hydrolase/oxidoreductase, putative [Plasmodium berghei]SCN23658.1 metallo-hydrolase/oxidoreductase, putative [Plasmodium berghei]SCO59198.1 metallo-hydrolase/oxidoreductase, putative [Plasmodium berghei]SCO60011.1 metallo-hydrolase/oxidoreductase, putative [Plasmodium berghei]|eukprot:XP_034420712.1 metallo-hydrolase/oxidoreductase, putative [Plasmodium berghei ANKA]
MFYFFYNCFFKYLITIYCLYSVSVIVCLRYKNCHSYLTFNNKESRKCLNNGYKNIKISRKIYVEGNKKLLKDNEILESCKDGYFENYKKKKIIRTLKNGINKLFFANRYLFGNIGFEEKAEQNNKDSYDKEWKEKKMNHDYYDIKKLENSLNIEPDKILLEEYIRYIHNIIEKDSILLNDDSFVKDSIHNLIVKWIKSVLIYKEEDDNLVDEKVVKEYNDENNNLDVESIARKLILFKTVLCNTLKTYGFDEKMIYIDEKTNDIKVKRNVFKDISGKKSDWKIIFLGTGSMYPSISRGTSSFIFQTTKKKYNEAYLFDCGENTFISLQKANIKISKIKNIFITHLHGDHCLGLISVLTMLKNLKTINIYGPEGIYRFLKNNFNSTYSKRIAKYFVYELKLKGNENNSNIVNSENSNIGINKKYLNDLKYIYKDANNMYQILQTDSIEINGFQIKHTIPTIGYIIKERYSENKFNAEHINEIIKNNYDELKKCKNLDYTPYKIYENVIRKMKSDDILIFPDNSKLSYKNAYKEIHKERKIVICQDTCDASSLLKDAQDADVLIHESTNSLIDLIDENMLYNTDIYNKNNYINLLSLKRENKIMEKNDNIDNLKQSENIPNDANSKTMKKNGKLESLDTINHYNKIIYERGHSTSYMAGNFAKKIRAKKLILTHFSQRYIGDNKLKNMIIMKRIENEALEAFYSDQNKSYKNFEKKNINISEKKKTVNLVYISNNINEKKETNDEIVNIIHEVDNRHNINSTNLDKMKNNCQENDVVAAFDGLVLYIPPQSI